MAYNVGEHTNGVQRTYAQCVIKVFSKHGNLLSDSVVEGECHCHPVEKSNCLGILALNKDIGLIYSRRGMYNQNFQRPLVFFIVHYFAKGIPGRKGIWISLTVL
jgi:hypothetical protein